jgi:hypothetical protein
MMDKERGSLGDRLSRYELEPRPEVLAGLKEKLAQHQKPKRRLPVFWIWVCALLIGSGAGIEYFQLHKNQELVTQKAEPVVGAGKSTSNQAQTSTNPATGKIATPESIAEDGASEKGGQDTSTPTETEKQSTVPGATAQDKISGLVIAQKESKEESTSGTTFESRKSDKGQNWVTGTIAKAKKRNRKTLELASGNLPTAKVLTQEMAVDLNSEKKNNPTSTQSQTDQETRMANHQTGQNLPLTNAGLNNLVNTRDPSDKQKTEPIGKSGNKALQITGNEKSDIALLDIKLALLQLAQMPDPTVQPVVWAPIEEETPAKKERKWRLEARFNSLYSVLREINIQQIQQGDRSRWLDKGGNFPNRMSMELGGGFLYPVSERLAIHLDAGMGFNREELFLTNSLQLGDSMTAMISGNQIILSPVQLVRQERIRVDRFYGMAGLGLNWKPANGFPELRFGAGYMQPLYQGFERSINEQVVPTSGARVEGSVYAWLGLNRTLSFGNQTFFVEPQVRYFNQPMIWFKEGTRMRPFQVGLSLGWKW